MGTRLDLSAVRVGPAKLTLAELGRNGICFWVARRPGTRLENARQPNDIEDSSLMLQGRQHRLSPYGQETHNVAADDKMSNGACSYYDPTLPEPRVQRPCPKTVGDGFVRMMGYVAPEVCLLCAHVGGEAKG
jgi:hypothetical protein